MKYVPLAIVASTVDDSHTWNLIGVELRLRERGFKVINLGCCTPPELLAKTVRQHRPDLTVISSVNGHGSMNGLTLAKLLSQYQAFNASLIVIGGKLTIDNVLPTQVVLSLKRAGYNAVLSGPNAWRNLDRLLERADFVLMRKEMCRTSANVAISGEVAVG